MAGKLKFVQLSESLVDIIVLYITGKLVSDSSACISKWMFQSNSQTSIMWAAK